MAVLHAYERAWRRISTLVKRQPSRCQIAVAYFGAGASELLPLRRGSTLVVDLSEHAVRSGQTKPSELQKLVKLGVDVHSVANLHAKVFVIGTRALIGSTNVSGNSAQRLIEAIVETNERALVIACRGFVRNLRGELAGTDYLRKMQKLYRPPKFGLARNLGRKQHRLVPHHSRLWTVPLEYVEWNEEDDTARDKALPAARAELTSAHRFKIEEFRWIGNGLERLHVNDQVIQVLKIGRKTFVHPVGRVLRIKSYRSRRGSRRVLVFLEIPRRTPKKNMRFVLSSLGHAPKRFRRLPGPWLVRDLNFAHQLLNLWHIPR